jgi:hypothetical protein
MICVPRDVHLEIVPLVSCEEPVMQEALEVRPRMRTVISPPVPGLTPPVPISGQELKPIMRRADGPPPPDPNPKPVPTVVIELRPTVKKAEED